MNFTYILHHVNQAIKVKLSKFNKIMSKDDKLLNPFRSRYYDGNTSIYVSSERSFNQLVSLGVRDPRLKFVRSRKALYKPSIDISTHKFTKSWRQLLDYNKASITYRIR